MTRNDSSRSDFDDIIRSGLKQLRGVERRAEEDAPAPHPAGSGRRFWAAVALLAVYWMGWGVAVMQWLFAAGPAAVLHGTLLVMMAAVGVLAAVMTLVASHVVEELRRAPGAAKVTAGADVAAPAVAPRYKEKAQAPKREPAVPPPSPRVAIPQPEAQVIAEGEIHGRIYRHFSDGSVEISTLLGMRRFASLTDARQFIGPSDAALVH